LDERHCERIDVVRKKFQLVRLLRHGFQNLRALMPANGRQKRGEGVEIFVAINIPNPAAFAAHINFRAFGEFFVGREMRQDKLHRIAF